MRISELQKLLKAGEWNDVEFKEGRTAVPKSAFETVSAFANTHGGTLVFGISQHGEEFSVSGVEVPEKLQNDFLSVKKSWLSTVRPCSSSISLKTIEPENRSI